MEISKRIFLHIVSQIKTLASNDLARENNYFPVTSK